MGFDIVILGVQRGQKLRNYLKKSQSSFTLQNQLYQSCFEKSYLHYTIVIKE